MKNKRSISVALALLLNACVVDAQNLVTFDASQGSSSFIFTNSSGEKNLDFQGIGRGAYSVGFRHESSKGQFYRVNIGARKAGAKYLNDHMQTTWQLNYFDLKAGAGYEIGKWKLRPYV